MPIHCTVLLFAQLADAAGVPALSITLPDGTTVSDALRDLSRRYTAIASMQKHLAVAVNERYAGKDDVIPAGATIALIPPVSGG